MNNKQLFLTITSIIIIFILSTISLYTVFKYNTLYDNYQILQNANKMLNEEIEQFNILLTEKNSEIMVLTESNKSLTENNTTLTEENSKLKTEVSNLQKKVKNTQTVQQPPTQTTIEQQVPQTNKVAYLTFDDGPSNNTISILNTLKEHNIKATFFINGNYNKEIVQRIINEGHAIGNHTNSHSYKKIYTSIDAFTQDFKTLENNLINDFGIKPTIMRFPGGSNNTVSYNYGGKTLMDELTTYMKNSGYTYFDWNVTSGDADSKPATKEQIVSNVVNRSANVNNAIVLMHDSGAKTETAKAVPEIITQLKNKGFSFDKLTENSPKVQFK